MGCLFSAGGTQQQQKHNNSPRGTTPPHPIVHIASSPAAIVTPAIRSPAPGTKVLLHPCCNCATIVADPLSSGRRPPRPPLLRRAPAAPPLRLRPPRLLAPIR